MSNLSDMCDNHVAVFRSVVDKFPDTFVRLTQYLKVGEENREMVRWVANEATDTSKLGKVSVMKKTNWGKVSKAPPLYEMDTDHTYVVQVHHDIFDRFTDAEQRMFAFYLLAQIDIQVGDKGVKFGKISTYAAERMLQEYFPGQQLPKPEVMASRFEVKAPSLEDDDE